MYKVLAMADNELRKLSMALLQIDPAVHLL